MSVYDLENFGGRVVYAAQIMRSGGETCRRFDTCFEMYDGNEVATTLWRMAQTDSKLMSAFMSRQYLCPDSVRATAQNLAHIADRDMARQAALTRKRSAEQYDRKIAHADA